MYICSSYHTCCYKNIFVMCWPPDDMLVSRFYCMQPRYLGGGGGHDEPAESYWGSDGGQFTLAAPGAYIQK